MSAETSNISLIQYLAILYNIVEAFFAILLGFLTRSMALTGFGLDSAAESLTGIMIVRKYKQAAGDTGITELTGRPNILAAVVSFIFGSYMLIEAIKVFLVRQMATPSLPGMLIPICSLIYLPVLAFSGYQTGHSVKTALILGMKDIWLYMLLSFLLLLGLGLNYCCGLWQADAIVGLVTVIYLYKKSLESLLT